MTAEDLIKMDGRILCDSNGEGVLITDMQFKEEVRGNSGEYKVRLVVSGLATAYLVNPTDANAGTVAIEPYPVEEGIDVEAEDKALFLSKLNRTFNIDPPLVDNGEDVLDRLTQGADGFEAVVGKRAHFRAALKKGSESSQYGPTIYTNLAVIPKRTTATKDALDAIRKKLEAKKGAKAKAGNLDAILGD